MGRLIIWGAGELGRLVAQHWQSGPAAGSPTMDDQALGGPILGLTKTKQRHAQLRALGVQPALGSATPWLTAEDVLLISLPGDARREAVAALAPLPGPRRAVLLSSTGYYGTPRGVVNEDTAAGGSSRAQGLAQTEALFRQWAGERGVVLRLGGLYRPGRGPMAALARRGTARKKAPNKTLPLIHYEDAAAAVTVALQRRAVAPVYLAVTPPCPTRRAFYEAACARLELPLPAFDEPLEGPPAEYDVSRLRRDLLARPAYPDWRAALVLQGER